MYLKTVSIKNFRQFNDFQVELNKGLNLLIGENNSGKTTLIDAIRLTLDTNSTEWVGIQESDFNQQQHADIHIQLKFEELSIEEAAIFIEHLTHEKYGADNPQKRRHVLYINLKASHKTLFNSNSRFLRTDVRSGENAEGPLIEKEIRKYLEVTYLKPLRDAENELSAGRNSRLSQILSSPSSKVGKPEPIEKLITTFIIANNAIKSISEVMAIESTIKESLSKVIFSTDSFNPVINILGSKEFEKLTDSEKRLIFKSILEKLSLNLSDNFTRQGMGYNNLLFMVAELMLLQSEQHLSNPLLLIEEPEAHLHPQLQMKFLQYISEKSGYTDKETQHDEEVPLSENKASKSIQCILSTHSPNLASKAPLENLIIMNQGVAYPLAKNMTKLEGNDYKFLKKFLDTTKANMFFAKGILMVEGDAENILLPTIANLLGTPLEDYGVSIVNIGSTAYKRYIRIYQRNESKSDSKPLPIKVANLVDLDLWPDEAEEKEGNIYGFKERKKKNAHYWLSYYETSEQLKEYKQNKLADDGDNVKTFISDYWTFEYCLAMSGLNDELCEAINKMNNKKWDEKRNKKKDEVFEGIDLSKLGDDLSSKALGLYKQIDKEEIKTEVSYYLAQILEEKYGQDSEGLRKKLPKYILDAFNHLGMIKE